MDQRTVARLPYYWECTLRTARERDGRPIPLIERSRYGHALLIDKFLNSLDGRSPMDGNVHAAMGPMAMVAAAAESATAGSTAQIGEILAEIRQLNPTIETKAAFGPHSTGAGRQTDDTRSGGLA